MVKHSFATTRMITSTSTHPEAEPITKPPPCIWYNTPRGVKRSESPNTRQEISWPPFVDRTMNSEVLSSFTAGGKGVSPAARRLRYSSAPHYWSFVNHLILILAFKIINIRY